MSALIPSGNASGTGTMTLLAPATNGTQTVTMPDATGTMMVSGNMPAFSYYASSATTLSTTVFAKISFQTSIFDTTSGMFSSSRFTPTIAGYYQISSAIAFGSSVLAQQDAIAIYKNGSAYAIGNYVADTGNLALRASISSLVYCNGSTDYIEIYGIYNAGPSTQAINTGSANTWFNGVLIRN